MDISRALANHLRQSDFALAEALWLLRGKVVQMHKRLDVAPDEPVPAPIPKPPPIPIPDVPTPEPGPRPKPVDPLDQPKPAPKPDPIYITTSGRSDWRFRAPGARALPEAPQLARALRPLRKRVASRQINVLDEAASVERSAELGYSSAVFVPARERWLKLVILADESAGMAIWQDTIKEVRGFCERASVFADVRLWRLDPQQQRIRAVNNSAPRKLSELNHSDGRQIIWVASSGIGSVWRDSTWLRTLHDLSNQQPLALLQLLPERLWERSALNKLQQSIACFVGASAPAAPNRCYRLEACEGHEQAKIDAPKFSVDLTPTKALRLPLLGLDASLMRAYAKLIAVGGAPDLPGLYIALGKDAPITPPATGTPSPAAGVTAMSAQEAQARIKLFKAEASAAAFELLQLLSGLPLQIPIMRLVQAALQTGRSGHGELAEVLYSGLIRRVSPATVQDPNQVEYNFFEPLRETLASEISLKQTLDVVDVLGDYLKQRHGHDYDFMAGAVIRDAPEKELTFAEVRGHLLRRLDSFKPKPHVPPIPAVPEPSAGSLQGKRILWLNAKHEAGDSIWRGASVQSAFFAREAASALRSSSFDALVCEFHENSELWRERLELLDELDQHGPYLPVVMAMDTQAFVLEAENFASCVCAPSWPEIEETLAEALSKPVQREQRAIWPDKVLARLDAPLKTVSSLEVHLLALLSHDQCEFRISETLKQLSDATCRFAFYETKKLPQQHSAQSALSGQNRLHFTAEGAHLAANLELAKLGVCSHTTRQQRWFEQILGALVLAFEAHHRVAYDGLRDARILWVDDNLELKALQKARLLACGCAVFEATSTQDAIAAIKKESIDAVITDLGRKGERLAGFQLAEQLAQIAPAMPVALYSLSAPKFSDWQRGENMVACTDNFDEVLVALSTALAKRQIEKPKVFESLIEWFDGIDFFYLPMPKRVELMTRLFCCVYRRNMGKATLRSFVLKSVVGPRIAANNREFSLPRNDGITVSHSLLVWENRALFAVATLCATAALEKPVAPSKMRSALEVLDNAPDLTFVTAALAELQAKDWHYWITDEPRAWIAINFERRDIDRRAYEAFRIALDSFGFGVIGDRVWFAQTMLQETLKLGPQRVDSKPWMLEVEYNVTESKRATHMACATAEDAKIIASNLAALTVSNSASMPGIFLNFDPGTDFDSFVGTMTEELQAVSRALDENPKQVAIFVHIDQPERLNREAFASAQASLANHRVFVLDGPMRTFNTGFNSVLIKLMDEGDVASAHLASNEAKAILLSTNSPAIYKRCAVQNSSISVFAVTDKSGEDDLAEFARGLRDFVYPKSYKLVKYDTQKHKFGNYPTRNRRTLSAKVMELPVCPGWFVVDIEVKAPAHWPLVGKVRLFLDETFQNNEHSIASSENHAQLTEFAWGPFTVGATCDAGLTRLELDLKDCLDSAAWLGANEAPKVRLNLAALELLALTKSKFKRWVFPERVQKQLDALSPEARKKTLKDTTELIRKHCSESAYLEHGVRVRYRVDNVDSKLAVKHASKVRTPVYVFMSHAKEDREAAKAIARQLESAGITVYILAESLEADSSMIKEINLALADCTHFISLIGAQSLHSEFVKTEVATANLRHIRKELKLVPVLLSDGDAQGWRDQFGLLESLQTLNYGDEKFFDTLLLALAIN